MSATSLALLSSDKSYSKSMSNIKVNVISYLMAHMVLSQGIYVKYQNGRKFQGIRVSPTKHSYQESVIIGHMDGQTLDRLIPK